MDITALFAEGFPDRSEEGSDVAVGARDLLVDLASRRIFAAASAGIWPSSAHASQAATSTSSQRWNLFWSSQTADISGRE